MSVLLGMLKDLDERGAAPQLSAAVAASIEAPLGNSTAAAHGRAGTLRLGLLLAGIAILAGSALYFWWPRHARVDGPGPALATLAPAPVLPAPPPALAAATIAPTPPAPAAPVQKPGLANAAPTPRPAAAAPHASAKLASIADLPHAQVSTPAQDSAGALGAGNDGVTLRAAPGSDPSAALAHAYDLAGRGRNTEALEALRHAVQLWPANAEGRLALASLLSETGQQEEALHVLLDGAAQDPARFGLAAARQQALLGAPAAALRTLQGVPAERRDVEYHAITAAIAQRAQRHDIAVREFGLALAAGPERAVWWVGLGASLEQLNQPADALAAYRKAQQLAGASPAVADFAARRAAALAGVGAHALPAPAVATAP